MTRPRQMRRHAKRMRRYGLQPMVVIDHDSQLPDLAILIILRAIWRYRSELAPVFLAGTAALVAVFLHIRYPGWWPYTLLAGLLASLAVAVLGEHVGLTRREERLYAATVAMSLGSWLAAATALGVTQRPLGHVLMIWGFVLAVPWWAHRRRRAKVRIDRKLAAWPEISQALGLAGSRVMSVVIDVWGWRARFGLGRGQTIHNVIEKVPAIESALGTHRGAVRVYPTPDDKANRFELRVLDIDPHADAISWPGPSVSSIAQPIDLGPFEDATPARVLFLRRHTLMGGIAGAGKSGGINVLMANLVACRDVVVWAIDLKRGMELKPWQSCLDRLATTPDEARTLLRDAVAILEGRADHLAAPGRRVWEPTPDMPALVIIIDEYAELADDAPEAVSDADSIARRGRAVAVTLVAATQRPTQKAMGQGAVRSQMDIRVSFRVRERRDVDLILGQGMLAAGWTAHTLNAPGKFLVSAPEHDTPKRARAYLLTDDAVSAIASHYADQRPVLDEVSRLAVEARRRGPRAEDASERPPAVGTTSQTSGQEGPAEALLQSMLLDAPDEGIPIALLMRATQMSKRTLYRRLNDLVAARRVVQVGRGRYRAIKSSDS